MLSLNKVSIKNFMSIGNVEETIKLNSKGLTLILGENLDLGGSSNRNGVGKTTLINAISYALYGEALFDIKYDNLINKINQKNMQVSLEFTKGNINYKIERGRKPNYLRYFINNKESNTITNDAEGSNKFTQIEIEKVLGMSHTLFKHIVALNVYTVPFLASKESVQRPIIEELLSIYKLSQKAESLKKLIKETKDNIKEEEYRINAVKESNNTSQKTINDISIKSSHWDTNWKNKKFQLDKTIEGLLKVDIEIEISNHAVVDQIKKLNLDISRTTKDYTAIEKNIKLLESNKKSLEIDLSNIEKNICPTCQQEIHAEHSHLKEDLIQKLDSIIEDLTLLNVEKEKLEQELLKLSEELDSHIEPKLFYKNIQEAYNHKNYLDSLKSQLDDHLKQSNPHLEQITHLSESALQKINLEKITELKNNLSHQEFLFNLLTKKDSFVRKKIIDQNLSFLNHRLTFYLDKLKLPHRVTFLNDLSVEITALGREYDFHNLSTGERNRLILALSWAFRDIYEAMNHPINVLFIDELVDTGMDQAGVEASLEYLKKLSWSSQICIYVISHRDELISRVSNILMVVKENGFTRFEYEKS